MRQKYKDEKLRQKVLGYVDLLFEEDDETRERAKKNLIRIGKKHRTSSIVTRNLTSALESDNWQAQQAAIEIEEVALIVIGDEAVAHNRNKVKGSDMVIETIEHYHFSSDGQVSVRYFIKKPA